MHLRRYLHENRRIVASRMDLKSFPKSFFRIIARTTVTACGGGASHTTARKGPALQGHCVSFLLLRAPEGHALRPRVPHAPQVDPVRRFASRRHVRLGRTLGGRERERVRLHKWATGGEGAASRIVNSCAVNTKSDRQRVQACDGHGPQCMSLRSQGEATAVPPISK